MVAERNSRLILKHLQKKLPDTKPEWLKHVPATSRLGNLLKMFPGERIPRDFELVTGVPARKPIRLGKSEKRNPLPKHQKPVKFISNNAPNGWCDKKSTKLLVRIDQVIEDQQEECPYWRFTYHGLTYYAWSPQNVEEKLDQLLEEQRELKSATKTNL